MDNGIVDQYGYNPVTGTYSSDTTSGGLLSGGNGGGLFGLSNLLNSIGSTFSNVWTSVNRPGVVTLPGGGILQNGQPYYPAGTVAGVGNGSFVLLLVGALVLFVVLKK